MLRYVISGTIEGEYEFPNEMFSGFCYESWGNLWAKIEGVRARYVPAKQLLEEPSLFEEIDILQCELGQEELIDEACERGVFVIATESGAGFEVDRRDSFEKKKDFIARVERCGVILSTTYAGCSYLKLFTKTPVLDIPLPISVEKFRPRRGVSKFEEFSVCLGEMIESCYDDRPLQILAARLIDSVGGVVVSSIPPWKGLSAEDFEGLARFRWFEHTSLLEMSQSYLARSHVSMMLAQRSTFGRFVYVSWAVGVPCIATRYQCQNWICPELTVSVEEVELIRSLLEKLRDNEEFYKELRSKGLTRLSKFLSERVVARRVLHELIPIYLDWRNR